MYGQAGMRLIYKKSSSTKIHEATSFNCRNFEMNKKYLIVSKTSNNPIRGKIPHKGRKNPEFLRGKNISKLKNWKSLQEKLKRKKRISITA